MWSDTLLAMERAHLVRLGAWGGASLVLGALFLSVLLARRIRAPLLWHFALQTALWGGAELALVVLRWHGLALRDFAGAVRLVTALRLVVAAEAACLAIGATLAVGGWVLARRPGVAGAGTAVLLQGVALLTLHGMLLHRVMGAVAG